MDCQFNTYSDETVRLFFQVLVHILMPKISVYTFYILFTEKLAKKSNLPHYWSRDMLGHTELTEQCKAPRLWD